MDTMRGSRRTFLWRRIPDVGLEYCDVAQASDGWQLAGVALSLLNDVPTRVQYQVTCDSAWQTRAVTLTQWRGAEQRMRTLLHENDDRWEADGQHLPHLAGCRDIDLGITPATNTLPIRRLALAVGESREVTAAWVRFPDLAITPLMQRYTRVADRRYRYESPGFATEITVDDWGLAVQYAGGWERVADGP